MSIKRKINFGFGTNPDNVSIPTLPPQSQGQLGGVFELRDVGWQFYQCVDAGPAVVGDLAYNKGYGGSAWLATRTIGNSSQNEPAGVFMNATILNNYTLLRKRGVTAIKSADATINARGLRVISDTSANRVILQANDTNAAQTKITVVGVAQAAQAAGFVSTYMDLPYV